MTTHPFCIEVELRYHGRFAVPGLQKRFVSEVDMYDSGTTLPPWRQTSSSTHTRKKIIHCCHLYVDNVHREASVLVGELPEESDQFRFCELYVWRILRVL